MKEQTQPKLPPRAEVSSTLADEVCRALLESAPVAMTVVNEHGQIEWTNKPTEAMFGYRSGELLGQPMELLVPERFRRGHKQRRERVVSAVQDRAQGQGTLLFGRRKDGSEFASQISLSSVRTTERTLTICVIRDVSAQFLTEEVMRQSRRFAESALESIPASVAVLDSQGVILHTNQGWREFAAANGGGECAAGKGANYLDVCDRATGTGSREADSFATGIRRVMSGELERFSMEYPCHAPHTQRWFVGHVTPFDGDGPHAVVVAHVEVTGLKLAEQEILRLNTELEARVAVRTQELQQANEELRCQIALRRRLEEEILQISEHEQQRIGRDLHDDLGQIIAGAWCLSTALERSLAGAGVAQTAETAQISSLLRKAMDMTRSLARGLHPVAPEAGGLASALRDLAGRVSEMFNTRCQVEGGCPHVTDNSVATHLFRIAQEAVTNAVRHGRAAQVVIHLQSIGAGLELRVLDDGEGMPEGTHHTEGMGLRIMHYRAEMIGASLTIQNEPAGGTLLRCVLPAAKRVESKASSSNGQESRPPSST